MPTTTPDDIAYADGPTAADVATITAAIAASVQAALDKRAVYNYRWADSTARAAQTGMRAGDEGLQIDTGVTYWYTGAAWVILHDGTTVRTYTPALTADTTNPTLGSGSAVSGRYWYLPGKMVRVHASILFGTSGVNPGLGVYEVSLPVAADTNFHVASTAIANGDALGSALLYDANATTSSKGAVAMLATASTVRLIEGDGLWATQAQPWTWQASDKIVISALYRYA